MATLVQHMQILNSWFLNLLNHKIAINFLTEMQILLEFQQKSTWPLWSTDQYPPSLEVWPIAVMSAVSLPNGSPELRHPGPGGGMIGTIFFQLFKS